MNTSSGFLVIIGICALVSTATSLVCYRCADCDTVTSAEKVSCNGSCIKGNQHGKNSVNRGCSPTHLDVACTMVEEEGYSAYVCSCNKDLCNDGPMPQTTTQSPTPNSGTKPDVPLILILPLCLMVYIYKRIVSFGTRHY